MFIHCGSVFEYSAVEKPQLKDKYWAFAVIINYCTIADLGHNFYIYIYNSNK